MRREYIKLFKALGDPTRLRIVKMLQQREMCLCEVREILGRSSSTVSKHLTVLRDAGLILDAKEGKWVNFRLNDKADQRVIRSLITLVKTSFEDEPVIREDAKKLHTVDRISICKL